MVKEGEPLKKQPENTEEEILEIEEKVDELHRKKPEGESSKSASSEGTRFAEIFDLGPDWQDFIIHMDKVAEACNIPEGEVEKLVTKFTRGELNDAGEEENRKRLVQLKEKFDKEIYPRIQKERKQKGTIIE